MYARSGLDVLHDSTVKIGTHGRGTSCVLHRSDRVQKRLRVMLFAGQNNNSNNTRAYSTACEINIVKITIAVFVRIQTRRMTQLRRVKRKKFKRKADGRVRVDRLNRLNRINVFFFFFILLTDARYFYFHAPYASSRQSV